MKARIVAALFVAAAPLFGVSSNASGPPGASQSCPSEIELDSILEGMLRGDTQSLDSFRSSAPCHSWVAFFVAASTMSALGDHEEAAGWLYVAQVHGRLVGTFITINWAIAWDEQHPVTLASLAVEVGPDVPIDMRTFEDTYQRLRQGLTRFRETVSGWSPEQLRQMRRENGLDDSPESVLE